MIFYDWFLDGKVFTKPEHSALNLNKTYTNSHPSLIGVGRNYETSITTNIIYLLQIKNNMPILAPCLLTKYNEKPIKPSALLSA